uniref:Uncharacterized protein n=1 Tax=Caenorhabditis japonica TaxID=281687 RepID=A0A8R1IEH9_CAEJA
MDDPCETLYHISAPFLAKDKCSLIIQKDLFKFGHLGAIVEMTIPMFLPFSITIERIFATQSAEHYEHTPVVLGPVLTVASTGG